MMVLYRIGNAQTIKRMDNVTWNAINAEVSASISTYDFKGISVAVVYGGNIAYANAFGDKNDAGDPFTIHTKSLLASISKTITGVLAMRLREEGHLLINDLVSDYLPGYAGTGIQVRDLMSHHSGIGHYNNCPDGYDGEFDSGLSYLTVLGCSICFTPAGSEELYSTFGSTLLGVIIDQIADDVYNTNYEGLYEMWMRQPGGLGTLEPTYHNLDPLLAEGEIDHGFWYDIGWKLPAGGFISDIVDLANYTRGLINNTFINQASFDLMKVNEPETGTPNFTCQGPGNNSFGLTFSVGQGNPTDENFRMDHNGENSHGFTSLMVVYPNRNASVVMLTNTNNGTGDLYALLDDIDELVLCPAQRDFTNEINWTEPRIFEGEKIIGRSLISSTYGQPYVFDAEDDVRLLPGFHAPAGKTFYAIAWDGCGGSVITD